MQPKLFRYHESLGFPKNIGQSLLNFVNKISSVNCTIHAAISMIDDKNTVIPLPSKESLLNLDNKLIEVYETNNNLKPSGIIEKVLIRVSCLDDMYDFSYVVTSDGFLVSAWSNEKDDIPKLTKGTNVYYSTNDKVLRNYPKVLEL